jgi:hypothetical protein
MSWSWITESKCQQRDTWIQVSCCNRQKQQLRQPELSTQTFGLLRSYEYNNKAESEVWIVVTDATFAHVVMCSSHSHTSKLHRAIAGSELWVNEQYRGCQPSRKRLLEIHTSTSLFAINSRSPSHVCTSKQIVVYAVTFSIW